MRKLISLVIAIGILSGCQAEPQDENATLAGIGISKTTGVQDGPFGIAMGQDVEGLNLIEIDNPTYRRVADIPLAHPEFEGVLVRAYPDVGVCEIKGVGRDNIGDGSGAQVRAQVDNLASALETKYGKPKKIDICAGGEIACENQFWMMSLLNGERHYGYQWQKTDDLKKANLDYVLVHAGASSIADTWTGIEYGSADTDACKAAENKAKSSAL